MDHISSPLRQALFWAHSRRKFFVLADISTNAKRERTPGRSPVALKAAKWIDALFDTEPDQPRCK
ncbi:hypothetical protein RHEC894_CH03429 [Rhizobium sp. CIAT894]|nr:hypothetical protein RHEC894_CH03429 [Rhizobium sp. CIAT894]